MYNIKRFLKGSLKNIQFMFPFWIGDKYIIVYAKDYETSEKKAIKKYKSDKI